MYTPGKDFSRARFLTNELGLRRRNRAARCLAPLASKAGSWVVFCLTTCAGMKAAPSCFHWWMGGMVGISLHSSFHVNMEVSECCGLCWTGAVFSQC
jgi:hypothetical protein